MGMLKTSPTAIAPLLFKNLITSIFINLYKPLVKLSEKFGLLQFLRHLFISCFLFLLRFIPSLVIPSSIYNPRTHDDQYSYCDAYSKQHQNDSRVAVVQSNKGDTESSGVSDSGVARALSQLLSIMNDIPVSSRKYEFVRSLAEKMIDDNNCEGIEVLRKLNRAVLTAAFRRTLGQLEAVVLEKQRESGGGGDVTGLGSFGPVEYNRLSRVWKAVGDAGVWRRKVKGEVNRSAEKLAAELLWLAEKMARCECGNEAVYDWAAAGKLGWLALTAEPRLQGSLVKVSAFLLKQAKDMVEEEVDEGKRQKEAKLKMLVSWLPLLCRANNGTDTPILSNGERVELEKILEDIIEKVEKKEEQEQVLSSWLHHFTLSSSTDWPNLLSSYDRWCNASRTQLLLQ